MRARTMPRYGRYGKSDFPISMKARRGQSRERFPTSTARIRGAHFQDFRMAWKTARLAGMLEEMEDNAVRTDEPESAANPCQDPPQRRSS